MKLFNIFISKDRTNNNNTATNEEELDEELGDFQLPLSLTPRASGSIGHTLTTANVIQHRRSTSSQQNIVLHSNLNESPKSYANRFDLNTTNDKDEIKSTKRKTSSLMTVDEHGSTNDLIATDASQQLKIPTSISDIIHQQTTDEKQTV
ncbi:unnamed protein product [Adineta steineri]|uniref:Uncharacterized protein n=1 Tax=Adineta steineri TaxID=433720 RepID=A0A814R9H5_9BILA|nr:unnamed protein product [Adineta steineri]